MSKQNNAYVLNEVHVEQDSLRHFKTILVTVDKDKAIDRLYKMVDEDKYGYFKKNGAEDENGFHINLKSICRDREYICSKDDNNYGDFVAYSIEQHEVE